MAKKLTRDQAPTALQEQRAKNEQLEERLRVLEDAQARRAGKDPRDTEEAKPIDSLTRNHRGEVIPADDIASYEDRQRAMTEAREAEDAELQRYRTEGLPVWLFRDPFGLIRRKDTGVLAREDAFGPEDMKPRGRVRPKGRADAEKERREQNERIKRSKATQVEPEDDPETTDYDPVWD